MYVDDYSTFVPEDAEGIDQMNCDGGRELGDGFAIESSVDIGENDILSEYDNNDTGDSQDTSSWITHKSSSDVPDGKQAVSNEPPAPLDLEIGDDNLSFMSRNTLPPNTNADGYIPDGKVSLTSTISDLEDTFNLYRKDGHNYALYNGHYYRIDGAGTVTINGIKYDKI